jgi:hypothetical protein
LPLLRYKRLDSAIEGYYMPKATKTATNNPFVLSKTKAKMPATSAVAIPAVAKARKPSKPAVAAQSAKALAKKKPFKRLAPSPVHRKPSINPEQRRSYVKVAAYFIAERHGFTLGREYEDWVAAEAEIDRMLAEGLLSP